MFSFKLLYFLYFICGLNADHPTYNGSQTSAPKTGLNATCGTNIRITPLISPVVVTQDPHWDEESGSIFFVSEQFPGGLHKYVVDTKEHYSLNFSDNACNVSTSFMPIKDAPNKYFFTCNDQFAILTWDGCSSGNATFKNITKKPIPKNTWPTYRLRNGKVLPNGALMVYSDPEILTTITGNNLFVSDKGKVKKVAVGFYNGVGVAFDRYGRWLYFCDLSESKAVLYKALYNEKTNSIERARIFLNVTEYLGVQASPDGITIDSEGYLWVVFIPVSMVAKLDPNTAEVLCTVKFPVTQLTNLAFGRCPNAPVGTLKCLYVTSVIQPNETYSGSVFLVEGIDSEGVLPIDLRLKTVLLGGRSHYYGP